jgi:hypothetical protein
MKTYRKTTTVQAKLFEKGDEDGMIMPDNLTLESLQMIDKSSIPREIPLVPYVKTIEKQQFRGEFGKFYVCTGVKGERWLVEKSIFESTYEEVK